MHTPLPWKLDLGLGAPEIVGNSRRIAMVLYHSGSEDNEVDYNAEFIVRACNSYANLLKELASLEQTVRNFGNGWLTGEAQEIALNASRHAKQAIEKAKI